METIIVANAQYWLDYLRRMSQDSTLSDADLEGAARALDTAAATPEAWPLIHPLATLLHPYMKRRGPWTGWDTFLHYLLYYAQQHADQEAQLAFLTQLGNIQHQRGENQTALDSYRRAWRLYLKPEVQPVLDRLRAISNVNRKEVLQGIPAEESEALIDTLLKIKGNLVALEARSPIEAASDANNDTKSGEEA